MKWIEIFGERKLDENLNGKSSKSFSFFIWNLANSKIYQVDHITKP